MPNYPVPCACGKTLDVPGTAAGSDVACACGRKVAVPSLARLKASVGEEAATVDFQIQQLLTAGLLPTEKACSICGAATGQTKIVEVVCERVRHKAEGGDGWSAIATIYLVGWAGYLMSRAGAKTKELGRETRFRLPVRVCDGCSGIPQRELLESVPLYARLLEKFPKSEVY